MGFMRLINVAIFSSQYKFWLRHKFWLRLGLGAFQAKEQTGDTKEDEMDEVAEKPRAGS